MSSLKKMYVRLERHKATFLNEAASWSAADLTRQPRAGSWCALDILDHLVKTEASIARTLLANRNHSQPLSMTDRVRGAMMCGLFYSPVRVKVPPSASAILPDTPSLAEVSLHWDATRALVSEVVSIFELPDLQDRGGVFRHPVAGWMSSGTTLRFLDSHLVHHGYQWRRLRRDLDNVSR